jgi:hypothetical protein
MSQQSQTNPQHLGHDLYATLFTTRAILMRRGWDEIDINHYIQLQGNRSEEEIQMTEAAPLSCNDYFMKCLTSGTATSAITPEPDAVAVAVAPKMSVDIQCYFGRRGKAALDAASTVDLTRCFGRRGDAARAAAAAAAASALLPSANAVAVDDLNSIDRFFDDISAINAALNVIDADVTSADVMHPVAATTAVADVVHPITAATTVAAAP